MGPKHIRRADLPDLAGVLARSFFDDPQMGWLFPDDASRADDLLTLFGLIGEAGLRRGHTYLLADGGSPAAAAVWTPPDVEPFTEDEAGPLGGLIADRYGEEGLGRLGAMSEAMGAHHPEESHFYLFLVGVEPTRQGQRLGERMVTAMLDRCDHDGMPVYLESSNPRNVGFYERLGFTIRHEFYPEGGPLFTGMWRDPR